MHIRKFLLPAVAVMSLLVSCSTQQISDDLLMQIKNVGLRKGVLIRRFQMTADYKQKSAIRPADVKAFIDTYFLSEYLQLQHAYDLGLHNDPALKNKIHDYQINLIAEEHPLKYKDIQLSRKALRALYEKKAVQYDLELVTANTYAMADSIYQRLARGDRPVFDKKEQSPDLFPQAKRLSRVSYGEQLHPDLLPLLAELKSGQVSRPVYTSPTWSLLKVERSFPNPTRGSYESMERELLMQGSEIEKYRRMQQELADLEKRITVTVNRSLYAALKSAFVKANPSSYISTEKLGAAQLAATVLQVGPEQIIVDHFVANLNQSNRFLKLTTLVDQDIDCFINDFKIQLLLYLDGLQQGVADSTLIKDMLVNKEYRLVLPEYLKREIVQPVHISDSEAQAYYHQHPQEWTGAFADVAVHIKNKMKNIRIKERQQERLHELRKKYTVHYNERQLALVAEELSRGKSAITK
jgi:hypothetical protein